jgi:hypothetical protein
MTPATAQFTPQSGSNRTPVVVHFNPVSLQYTVTNTLENKGSGSNKKQYVTQSSGKLTMDLIFDTTHNGQDVRGLTEKVARFMEPDAKKIPAVVLFEWGTYKFQGMLESYKETLDFFAPNGVPLRAAVNLTLSKQDKVFEPTNTSGSGESAGGALGTQGALSDQTVFVPTPKGAGGASDLGNKAGAPEAARAIGAANGQESLRFSAGGGMALGGSVSLGPPVAFASAGASAGGGIGIGGGVGGGASLGVSGGASAGVGVSGGAGVSAGAGFAVGARGSAGVSASAGAFAGLHSKSSSSGFGASLDVQKLLPQKPSVRMSTDSGATFKVGGKASVEGSASLSADVGASATLRGRVRFD